MNSGCDIATQVSPQLSAVIQAELDREDTDEPARLGTVLERVHRGLFDELVKRGRLDASAKFGVVKELKALIEQYGGDVLAVEFMGPRASENLAKVIEAELDNENRAGPPTLGAIRDSIMAGRAAKLIGTGDIDMDDDDTLIDEIQTLIARHGEDAAAEDFLP